MKGRSGDMIWWITLAVTAYYSGMAEPWGGMRYALVERAQLHVPTRQLSHTDRRWLTELIRKSWSGTHWRSWSGELISWWTNGRTDIVNWPAADWNLDLGNIWETESCNTLGYSTTHRQISHTIQVLTERQDGGTGRPSVFKKRRGEGAEPSSFGVDGSLSWRATSSSSCETAIALRRGVLWGTELKSTDQQVLSPDPVRSGCSWWWSLALHASWNRSQP